MSTDAGPRRIPWWRPILAHAADRNVAGAIYGLILATSVIAVSREYVEQNAGVTAVTVVVTATVFWLAHVYAHMLAFELRERRVPTRHEARAIFDREWPLVQATLLPTVVLLLGPLGLLADKAAQVAALVLCVVELAVTGVAIARLGGARGIVVAGSGLVATSFGLVVIALKVLVH